MKYNHTVSVNQGFNLFDPTTGVVETNLFWVHINNYTTVRVTLKIAVQSWLCDSCKSKKGDTWDIKYNKEQQAVDFHFINEDEAALFKLTWVE